MAKNKHVIWSNLNLNVEDWRDDYKALIAGGLLDADPNDEAQLYDWMVEENNCYLGDERMNLNLELGRPILVVAELGLWDGKHYAYKLIESGNIGDCLSDPATDDQEWYVDSYGNMRGTGYHHDGVNCYLYRVLKPNVTDDQLENLLEKILRGHATTTTLGHYTDAIGPYVANVYGWDVRKSKKFDPETAVRPKLLSATEAVWNMR